jgi:hypothetical protein
LLQSRSLQRIISPPGNPTAMVVSPLSNVPVGTANILAYTMIIVVAIFLLSGPLITYYYWKRNKRMKETSPASPA